MDTKSLWQAVLGDIEVSLTRANFRTWFKNTSLEDMGESGFVVYVPNGFAKEWLANKYDADIKKTLRKLGATFKSLNYAIKTTTPPEETLKIIEPKLVKEEEKQERKTTELGQINPRYTFENFLVANNNKLAYSAAKAVAQNPGTSYNPLFIYGSVGLGKTHLLHAIGNEILANSPKKKIIYASCERFVNQMIDAIRSKNTDSFKNKYRKADVLMIDDVQFLAGKVGSQEEFFHTFNELHEQNKQIILSSDRPPKSIPTLEDRLRSRFEWGMMADVQAPDIETRTAILKLKAEEKKIKFPEPVLFYIAENIENNVRELEGALTRVIAYLELNSLTPTVESVAEILKSIIKPKTVVLFDEQKVLRVVASFYNITVPQILGTKRNKELVFPRQVAMYIIRENANLSFPKIAKLFGGKDHTTVMHSCEKIENIIKEDENLRQELSLIRERVKT